MPSKEAVPVFRDSRLLAALTENERFRDATPPLCVTTLKLR